MKCKNKAIKVFGQQYVDYGELKGINFVEFTCIITNDNKGKTLSIDNGTMQFTIPFEPIEKYLR